VSYRPLDGGPVLSAPFIAYRDYLQDGTVAVVGQLAEPHDNVSVVNSGLTLAVKDRYVVAWGTRAEMDRSRISFTGSDHPVVEVGRSDLALTATYQDQAFEDRCQQSMKGGGVSMSGNVELTARTVPKTCSRSTAPTCGSACATGTTTPTARRTDWAPTGPRPTSRRRASCRCRRSSPRRCSSSRGTAAGRGWPAPSAGTLSVDVTLNDGTIVPAQVGGDVYAVWLPGKGDHRKVVATTATEIWTAQGTRSPTCPGSAVEVTA